VIISPGNASTASLLKVLETGNEHEREMALSRLAGKPDRAALPAVVAALRDPAVEVRSLAREPFRKLAERDRNQAATSLIEAALKAHAADPTDDEIMVLGSLPPKNAVALIEALWTSAPEKRPVLIDVARSIPGEEASAFLVKNFDAIENPTVRQLVVIRFGEELYAPAVEVIGPLLSSRDPILRENARATLEAYRKHREALEEFERWKTGGAESRASIAELVKLLDSTDRAVVVAAVKALGAVKARSALPALVKLMERKDPAISNAVEEAIKKMGE
jgi:HEAT repeat protein